LAWGQCLYHNRQPFRETASESTQAVFANDVAGLNGSDAAKKVAAKTASTGLGGESENGGTMAAVRMIRVSVFAED